MQRVTSFVLALLIFASAVVSALFVIQAIRREQEPVSSVSTEQIQESINEQQNQEQPKENENMLKGSLLADFAPVTDRLSELKIKDIKVGEGDVAQASSTVSVHYTGATMKDAIVFESSKDTGQPATFPLQQLIQGWQEGIPGMKVGGVRRLEIPAAKAYGESGRVSGDLVFDIELIAVQN